MTKFLIIKVFIINKIRLVYFNYKKKTWFKKNLFLNIKRGAFDTVSSSGDNFQFLNKIKKNKNLIQNT